MVSRIQKKGFGMASATGTVVQIPERVFTVEFEQEADGRWLAEVTDLDGVMAYGDSPQHAVDNAVALAYRVLAEEISENTAPPTSVKFKVA